MSLRALSSLVIRRFSPRRIPTATAQAETIHVSVGAIGALSVAALAGAGFLYLKKDGKVVGEVGASNSNVVVTDMGASNSNVVVTDMGAALNDPSIIAMFTDKDGNTSWIEYNDYLVFRANYLDTKTRLHDKETSRKVPVRRVGNVMKVDEAALKRKFEAQMKKLSEAHENYWKAVMEQEYEVDEAVMEKRFEDWMEEYGRTYKDEEEEARRYEVFKANMIRADKINLHGRRVIFGPSNRSDWTEDELRRMDCCHIMDWKSYFEDMRRFYAEGRVDTHRRNIAPQELDCTDAVKKRFKELAARKAEQERQANRH